MNADILPALARAAIALLIGLLIGLDRERAEDRKAHQVFAGVRTFPLIALAGCIPVLLLDDTGPLFAVGALLAVAGIVIAAYVRASAAGDIGATTEFAALITFLLGALAGAGQLAVAGAIAVAMSVLLYAKAGLERFSRTLTPPELSAALQFAVITVIVLPVLPAEGYGPWGVLNPREIWLVVVMVSGLSFLGFLAVRLLGEGRGLAATGAVGGLVSSTAVTIAMAGRSQRSQDEVGTQAAAGAAVLGSTVMCARMAVFAAAINTAILPRLAPVLGVMAATGVAHAWLMARNAGTQRRDGAQTGVHNPFSLWHALTFAAIYAAVLMLVQAGREWLGAGGLYAAAGLAAVADVDAATVAVTRLGSEQGSWRAPAAALALAAVINTLVKLGLASALGSAPFRRRMGVALGTMAAAGAAAAVVVYLA